MKKHYIHIIEYRERGPLWRLVDGLTCFRNHKVLETKNLLCDLNGYDEKTVFIFHTSGKNFPMISHIRCFLDGGKNCAIFIHTLPDYIIRKGFRGFLTDIYNIQFLYNVKIMVPSIEAQIMFSKYAIQSFVVHLGIPSVDSVFYDKKNYLDKYSDRIVTVSTKNDEKYKQAKGIDLFYQLMENLGCLSQALILGYDGYDKIESVKLKHEDFLYVLSKAKVYIQLSRSESYNISAIEAKQLKVPLLVSDVGGHKDSVPDEYFRVSSLEDTTEKFREIIYNKERLKDKIINNYNQSIKNESIYSFKNRIESIV